VPEIRCRRLRDVEWTGLIGQQYLIQSNDPFVWITQKISFVNMDVIRRRSKERIQNWYDWLSQPIVSITSSTNIWLCLYCVILIYISISTSFTTFKSHLSWVHHEFRFIVIEQHIAVLDIFNFWSMSHANFQF
jgi:hypothetical protein